MLTQEIVQFLFDYDPETGSLRHKNIISTRMDCLNKEVGYIDKGGGGYRKTTIAGKSYCVHRLIWLYVYGKFPEEEIDHIDRDKLNNSLLNLREATRSENCRNRGKSWGNSGVKGVHYEEKVNRYVAHVKTDRGRISKSFPIRKYGTKEKALELATEWVREIREMYHDTFTNHG